MTASIVLADGPGVGKSMATIGLCAAVAALGGRVAPFKAVLVTDDPQASGMEGHLLAAGLREDPRVGPVVVRRSAVDCGEAELMGRRIGAVRLRGRDSVDLTSLAGRGYQDAHDAVLAALDGLLCTFEHVVLEGAGGLDELDSATDLPNVLAPRAVDAATYILTRCPGYYPQARIRSMETVLSAIGTETSGHLLTGCSGSCRAPSQAGLQPLLGHIPLLDRIAPGLPQQISVASARAYVSACESAIRGYAPALLTRVAPERSYGLS
ncbi:hypothetical protein ACIGJO_31340 [Streptomyces sp. NPDC079020]|uniref:hypothetical protein n=1 Tax=Streptomyces sp. NPDC079020 TaxID=3365722 RepID=UPI0037D0893B